MNWEISLSKPNLGYSTFDLAFKDLPEDLKIHRFYFEQDRRGFGDRAFHVMWFELVKYFTIKKHLEIGVYRGQTLSLVAILQRSMGIKQNVTGITPLTKAGDSYASYIDIDYERDILKNFHNFALGKPELIKTYSTDGAAIQFMQTHDWDSIYIDGSHDYDVVKRDWEVCSTAVREGGIIILDDAALHTKFTNGFQGWPGPSRLAKEIEKDLGFRKILQVGHNIVFYKLPQEKKDDELVTA
jgi:hypothetical protein